MIRFAEETDLEVKNGPIWTQVTVTTFTGDREESPEITNRDVLAIEDITWGVISQMRDPMTGPGDRPELPINFAGDITQRDLYCFKDSEITAFCFIKHNEDFLGIRVLNNLMERLKMEIPKAMGEPFVLRNLEVVAESWVEQHHPEIVDTNQGQ